MTALENGHTFSERRKIAYVVSRFPHLPETFILREMMELEKLGWEVSLYPLVFQNQAVVHEEARSWLSRVRRSPHFSGKILKENARMLAKKPARYSSLWMRILLENRQDPKFLVRAAA